MTPEETPAGGPDRTAETVARPDTDDYDLLTFGEVAARLSEELAEERAELATARGQDNPDPHRIRRIEERIEQLTDSVHRYRDEQHTSKVFARRFGSIPALDDERPTWQ